MRERGNSLSFTQQDWKNKSAGHVSFYNLSFEVSTKHTKKTSPMHRPTAKWPLKCVITNLQSVLWYSTAVSYHQVMIHTLEAQCHLTSWSFWRTECLLHSITWLKQNSGVSPEGQQLLVTTKLSPRLTGLRPSKTRHSEHLVMAINQLLKRTDHDRWWVTPTLLVLQNKSCNFSPLILMGSLSGGE